jgi:hypothetical protein
MTSGEDNWSTVEDSSGRKLYFNETTGITTFDKPDVLKTESELIRVHLFSPLSESSSSLLFLF